MTNRRLIISLQQRGGTKAHHPVITAHARAVMAELAGARLANTMRLTIKIRAKVPKKNAQGLCYFRDHSKGSTARAKHYTIVLDRGRSLRSQLSTLTHEIQHAVQMAQGRLAVRTTKAKGRAWYWRPQGHVGASICYTVEEMPAWADRPWEQEAMAAEANLKHLI